MAGAGGVGRATVRPSNARSRNAASARPTVRNLRAALGAGIRHEPSNGLHLHLRPCRQRLCGLIVTEATAPGSFRSYNSCPAVHVSSPRSRASEEDSIARKQGLSMEEGAWRTRGIIIPKRPRPALAESTTCAATGVQPLRFRVSVIAAKAPSLLPLKHLLLARVLRLHHAGSAFHGSSFSGRDSFAGSSPAAQRSRIFPEVRKRSNW